MKLPLFAASALLLASTAAFADGDKAPAPDNPEYREECGGCHMAYPPRMLTGDNWQRIMDGLDRHFGSDASIDAQDRQDILGFLLSHAGRGAQHNSAGLRVSETPWFDRRHHGIPDRVYSNQIVRSRSNCVACHANAEHDVWHSPPHAHSRGDDNDD